MNPPSLRLAPRPRRGLRRIVPGVPALPPPTSPLPEVPPVPLLPAGASAARRPLTRRMHALDNGGRVSVEDACAPAHALPVPHRRGGSENAMQVDYPSPVDGAAFEWARPSAAQH